MNQYTIYCTEEQTKKALKLGAPIERGHDSSRYFNIGVPTFFDENDEICRVRNSVIFNPTAEQMLGWLEEQEIFIHIDYDFSDNDKPYKCEMCLFNGMTNHRGWFTSRKEATLAAIDAALNYLANKK